MYSTIVNKIFAKVSQALANCVNYFSFYLFNVFIRSTNSIWYTVDYSTFRLNRILVSVGTIIANVFEEFILYYVILFYLKMMTRRVKRAIWIFLNMLIVYSVIIFIYFLPVSDRKKSTEYPSILWWTPNFGGHVQIRVCNECACNILSERNASNNYEVGAYLFYGSQIKLDDLPPARCSYDIWGLYHEESPRNVPELTHEPMLNLFNFSATFSRYSNVPYPLQYLESLEDITNVKHFVPTSEKNKLLKDIAPIMYLQTDCDTSTERDAYVKELMKYIQIDSYGECLQNKVLPQKFKDDYLNNLNDNDFLNFVGRYKFILAIENGVCEDYVTEKFWRPIKVGSVPIYFGSPSIKDWFPNEKSAILLDDFPTPEIMSKHLKQLLANDSLYEEYLEHKTKRIITNHKLIEEIALRPYQSDGIQTVELFECYICEQLYRRKYYKQDIGINIVNKSHYDCPKPVSSLTLSVNPTNSWVYSWNYAKTAAEKLYKKLKRSSMYCSLYYFFDTI